MRVLVTGADGFVGRHTLSELARHGHDVIAASLNPGQVNGIPVHKLDVTNSAEITRFVQDVDPDAVIHLAGLAHTKDTEGNLPLLFDVNVASVSHLCEALRAAAKTRKRSVLIVSSAFVYGGGHKEGLLTCDESTPLTPRGSYGYSKAAAEASALMYDGQGLKVYVARPFNHIGPGQHPSFVVAGFAQRIARAGDGDGEAIITGSLDSKRDFTDVRDVARGYRLILEKSPAQNTFVFGSGKPVRIQEIFSQLCQLSGKNLTNTVDPALVRPNDDSIVTGSSRLALDVLGWRPEISLRQSLEDAYKEFAR